MTSNYRLFCRGINGETTLDAEQWGANEWRFTGPDLNGMLVAARSSMVTTLANCIGDGKVWSIDFPGGRLVIDRLGGTWGYNDDRYYPAGELINLLIPADKCES